MNKPVSYPLSILCKEKGFNNPITHQYYTWLGVYKLQENSGGKVSNSELQAVTTNEGINLDTWISAPTIADVVMWLYEKHGIWLYCEIKGDNFYVKAKKIKSNWRRVVSGVVDNENILFNSPIEAYEAGIKYCLEKVI